MCRASFIDLTIFYNIVGSTETIKKGREELFRYLLSHKNSTSKKLRGIKKGILLLWHDSQISPSKPYRSKPSKLPELPVIQTEDSLKDWKRKIKEHESKVNAYVESVLSQETYFFKPNTKRKVILELWEIEVLNKKYSNSIIEFSKKYSNQI